jgi:hypothetical protein
MSTVGHVLAAHQGHFQSQVRLTSPLGLHIDPSSALVHRMRMMTQLSTRRGPLHDGFFLERLFIERQGFIGFECYSPLRLLNSDSRGPPEGEFETSCLPNPSQRPTVVLLLLGGSARPLFRRVHAGITAMRTTPL